MAKAQINVQDQFLNKVRKERIRVTVELTTGKELEGYITSFDNFSLILKSSTDQLIYKHAISCISPYDKSSKFETFSERTRI
jgi:host factor-I protein